jgi:hypothetical protein
MIFINRPLFLFFGTTIVFVIFDSYSFRLTVTGSTPTILETIFILLLSSLFIFINVKVNKDNLEYRYFIIPFKKLNFSEITFIDSGWFLMAYALRNNTNGIIIIFVTSKSIVRIAKHILEMNPYCKISWKIYRKIKKQYGLDYFNNIN